ALAHLGANAGALAVHGDAAFADQAVGLAPGTVAGVADVTVEPHGSQGSWEDAQSRRSRAARLALCGSGRIESQDGTVLYAFAAPVLHGARSYACRLSLRPRCRRTPDAARPRPRRTRTG